MATCIKCSHHNVCYKKPIRNVDEDLVVIGGCSDYKPTADVEEVKHGEWIPKASTHISKRGRLINYDRYKCSVCGVWNGRHKPNYCPHCGAKMDGGKEE